MTHQHHSESDSSDSTPPIKLSRSTWVSAPLYGVILFVGFIVASAFAWNDLHNVDATNADRITRLEGSLQKVDRMQDDLSYIRGLLDRKYTPSPLAKMESNPTNHP